MAHYAGVALSQRLDLPRVETYHTFFEEYLYHYVPVVPRSWMRAAARRFSRARCNDLDAVVVPSRAMRDMLRDYGVRVPVEIIPTGIELERLSAGDGAVFRQRYGIARDRRVLVHVGRLAHEKNIDFLLRMLTRVRAAIPEVLLILAGEGPARGHLQRLASRLHLDRNILFLGYLDRRDALLDCYCAGDAFVFASRTETQGLVLLEAMALGLPVVSTAVMGTRDILEPGRGALVAARRRSGVCRPRGESAPRPGGPPAAVERGARLRVRVGRAMHGSAAAGILCRCSRPPGPAGSVTYRIRQSRNALTPFCDYPSRYAVDWRDGQSVEETLGDNEHAGRSASAAAQVSAVSVSPHGLDRVRLGRMPGALLDASFNGALFEASSRLSSQLSDCVLIIPFSRDPEEAIRLQAEVAYRRGVHMGLHWEQIDAESSMKLRRLVEMNLGTLRLLERPLLSLIWPPANQPPGRGAEQAG